jgi:hypothetical protein
VVEWQKEASVSWSELDKLWVTCLTVGTAGGGQMRVRQADGHKTPDLPSIGTNQP